MNKQQILALRKQRDVEFQDVSQMGAFLKRLLGRRFVLPVVVGERDSPKYWKVECLQPLTSSTKLTIENYMLGLEELKERGRGTFQGEVWFNGLDGMHYSNFDTNFMSAEVWEVRKGVAVPPSSSLRFFYSHDSKTDTIGYRVASQLPSTEIERVMGRFMAPDREYKPLLI